jgi:hypothetical protein
VTLAPFHTPVGHLYVSFGEMSIQVLSSSNWVFCVFLFCHKIIWVPYRFGILILYQIHDFKYFLPFLTCLFMVLIASLARQKLFSFMELYLSVFALFVCGFSVFTQEVLGSRCFYESPQVTLVCNWDWESLPWVILFYNKKPEAPSAQDGFLGQTGQHLAIFIVSLEADP